MGVDDSVVVVESVVDVDNTVVETVGVEGVLVVIGVVPFQAVILTIPNTTTEPPGSTVVDVISTGSSDPESQEVLEIVSSIPRYVSMLPRLFSRPTSDRITFECGQGTGVFPQCSPSQNPRSPLRVLYNP